MQESATPTADPFQISKRQKLAIRKGWSSSSIGSYYSSKFTPSVQKVLDFFKDNPDKELVWLSTSLKRSPNTLYLIWWQASRYLSDTKPELNTLIRRVMAIRVHQGASRGVLFRYRKDIDFGTITPENVATNPEWKQELEEWIENAKDKDVWIKEKVFLNESDTEYIESIMGEYFLWNFKNNTLTVIACLNEQTKKELSDE